MQQQPLSNETVSDYQSIVSTNPSNQQIFQNPQQTATVYQYTDIQQSQVHSGYQSSLQLLYNEIDLLQVAGEITEVEAADLRMLAFQGDNRIKEAIRYHSQYDMLLSIYW